ncbi:MAG: glycine cleavage system protein R [Candidatus Accumulibacter phosphatis]|uniref:Formyltetrahydrofolate deformylase n=2 Tax=Candidatus Accumulibacter TaxID=327159 RepID=A0A080MC87_9PROT|nr:MULTISPECIES: ACT domain-containing protein [Candidatus Accumulibacter]KFB74784.1 MAG: formyltetrahydrofolate deformylase [Candidatus Accumulibacter cognatus]MBL8401778.1 glycine cleavage system protein R [Accumulibacter sp.]MBN8518115.1 glycine cleavage system protein R [Accumulibacter sp.]MBO3709549.1 glycine cleavage system protein R [Accumulibacter sp.]MCC2868682.1 glycine cleavage system protein R [Candidatus Accumulibacter phosphatis]
MNVSLVLTVIGDDHPGLVEQLATTISQHQGNWLESSMSNLSGKFAGIVCVSVAEAQLAALSKALAALPGLRIISEVSRLPTGEAGQRRLKLSLVGHDRIGIVREVSQVLARHALNVEDLSTYTASAPMSAGMLFHASIELTAASKLDASELTRELESLSNDLMVDITLDEADRN